MKTTCRPTSTVPKLPAPPRRQLSMAFETASLMGIDANQRATAIQALAAMLLQAAGVHLAEDDDDER